MFLNIFRFFTVHKSEYLAFLDISKAFETVSDKFDNLTSAEIVDETIKDYYILSTDLVVDL